MKQYNTTRTLKKPVSKSMSSMINNTSHYLTTIMELLKYCIVNCLPLGRYSFVTLQHLTDHRVIAVEPIFEIHKTFFFFINTLPVDITLSFPILRITKCRNDVNSGYFCVKTKSCCL